MSDASPPVTCERFSLVDTCTVSLVRGQRGGCCVGVGRGRQEVAAHPHEHVDLTSGHGPDGLDDVVAVAPRRFERELGAERGEEVVRGLLDDAHRAVALHVAVPAHGADPGAGPADAAAQQERVDDLSNGGAPPDGAG